MTLFGISFDAAGTLAAAVIVAALWLPFALHYRSLSRGATWLALPLGALLFLVGVFGVQTGLQTVVSGFITNSVSPFTLAAWPVLIAVPTALIAATVQEVARTAAIAASIRGLLHGRGAVAAGALAGAGVGLAEAAWILSALSTHPFPLSAAVLERVFAIMFHVGAGALIGVGFARGRVWGALLLAILLHTGIDSAAALFDLGQLAYSWTLVILIVVAVVLYAATLFARSPDLTKGMGAAEGA